MLIASHFSGWTKVANITISAHGARMKVSLHNAIIYYNELFSTAPTTIKNFDATERENGVK